MVDAVLSVTVSQLREALEDDPPAASRRCTARGYRWVGTLAPEAGATSPRARTESPAATLVGREAALADLEAAAARAASGRRQVVFVSGLRWHRWGGNHDAFVVWSRLRPWDDRTAVLSIRNLRYSAGTSWCESSMPAIALSTNAWIAASPFGRPPYTAPVIGFSCAGFFA